MGNQRAEHLGEAKGDTMSVKRIEHTGTFSAVDKDGMEYTVHELTEILGVSGTFRSPPTEMEGMKSLKISSGEHVNRIEKGRYEVVSAFGNIPITSDDPNAP
jgi:hypothetical protein